MTISVSSSDELIRLDTFLSSRLIQFSRSKIQKLISEDSIKEQDNNIKNNTFTLRLAEIEQNIIINSIFY